MFDDHFERNDKTNIEKSLLFFQELKARIHRRLLERLDLSKVDLLTSDELSREIGYIIESLIVEEGVPLNQAEKARMVDRDPA